MPDLKGLILATGTVGDPLIPGAGARVLVPVGNKPLIHYGLEAMRAAGIAEIAVAVSPETREDVREAVADGSEWGARVSYVEQLEPPGMADSLIRAAAFADGSPLLVHAGDGLLRDGLGAALDAFRDERLDGLLVVRSAPAAPGASVTQIDQARSLRLVDAPAVSGADVRLAGIALFSPRIFDAARATVPSWRGVREITDAIDRLVSGGGRVRAHEDGWWQYDGRPESLLEGNRLVLEDTVPDWAGATLVDAEVQGRVAVHPTATLRSTIVRGPVVIGPGAHISDAYIGPYTAVGSNVTIEGAELENSIILPGGAITHVGGRLEASVVGTDARVFRDFALPKAMRLRVGGCAEIALA